MQEVETAAEVSRRLASYGYDVHQVGGGVVGVLENGQGPAVLFRADIGEVDPDVLRQLIQSRHE